MTKEVTECMATYERLYQRADWSVSAVCCFAVLPIEGPNPGLKVRGTFGRKVVQIDHLFFETPPSWEFWRELGRMLVALEKHLNERLS